MIWGIANDKMTNEELHEYARILESGMQEAKALAMCRLEIIKAYKMLDKANFAEHVTKESFEDMSRTQWAFEKKILIKYNEPDASAEPPAPNGSYLDDLVPVPDDAPEIKTVQL